MKWELDDNARGGFHYLLLGVLVIGVPSGLLALFDLWHGHAEVEGSLPLGVFHNGYILMDGDRTAVADTSRGERLIHALAISFVGAAAATSVLLLVHFRRAWRIGRGVFVTCFTWGVVSALFLPRTSARITPGHLEVSQRSTIVGDITLPFSTRTAEFAWQPNDTLLGLSLPAAGVSDFFRMAAYRVHLGDTLLLATTDARGGYFERGASATPADKALDHMDSLLFKR